MQGYRLQRIRIIHLHVVHKVHNVFNKTACTPDTKHSIKMCNAYRLDYWCSNLKCTCSGSMDFAPLVSFGCALAQICRGSSTTLRFAIRAQKQNPNTYMPDAIYQLKQLKLPWAEDEAVGNIRLAPDSIAGAKGVAALAGGGPAPYTRWAHLLL